MFLNLILFLTFVIPFAQPEKTSVVPASDGVQIHVGKLQSHAAGIGILPKRFLENHSSCIFALEVNAIRPGLRA